MVDVKLFQYIPLFQHVSARRRKQLCSATQMEHYPKGALLFRQGGRAEAMYVVLDGWVHLIRSTSEIEPSQGAVLFTITKHEALCGISAIGSGIYHLSAVAGTDCRVVRILADAFNEALKREPEFAYHALRLCARRLQHIAQQYGTMAEPVSKRVVRSILRLRQQFGDTLPVTHRELGQMAWTTTESAIRVVRSLKQNGSVSGGRGRLMIRQPGALERFLADRNGRSTL